MHTPRAQRCNLKPSELNEATCHCGKVSLKLAEKPTEVFECSCSICRRLGVLWAYYHCDSVTIETGGNPTNKYVWNNEILEFHRCTKCGCTTHWVAKDLQFRDRMGVNARLIDGLNRSNTKLGYVDHGATGWFWSQDSAGRPPQNK